MLLKRLALLTVGVETEVLSLAGVVDASVSRSLFLVDIRSVDTGSGSIWINVDAHC